MNASGDLGITEVLRAFESAWAARDATRLGSLFTADADYIDFAGDLLHGRDAVVAAHARVFAGPLAHSAFSFTSWQEVMLADDVVLGHARWELTGQLRADGSTLAPRHGIITFVLLAGVHGDDLPIRLAIRAGQNTEALAAPFGRDDY